MVVIGRDGGGGPVAQLGHYRAPDGSRGGDVTLDLDSPHVGLVVGKRGTGKSYTLGVLAEELAATAGVAPVVVDPMGAFATLDTADVDATVVEPRVRADSLGPRQWCTVLGLEPDSGAGSLVWRVADECETLAAMRQRVTEADVGPATRRGAANHLRLAAEWSVCDPDGLDADRLGTGGVTVLDLSGQDRAPAGAAVAAVATALYDARVAGATERLPWLLVDEAHAFTDGVASDPLGRVLTRGRQPGVSTVLATQRPSALPEVAVSQADLRIAHRLTARADIDAFTAVSPTYLDGTVEDRLPGAAGEALVVDDCTESVHEIRVRERRTPHGGDSARVTDRQTADAITTHE